TSRNRPACDDTGCGFEAESEVEAASTAPERYGVEGGIQSTAGGGPPEPRLHGAGATTAGRRWRFTTCFFTWRGLAGGGGGGGGLGFGGGGSGLGVVVVGGGCGPIVVVRSESTPWIPARAPAAAKPPTATTAAASTTTGRRTLRRIGERARAEESAVLR